MDPAGRAALAPVHAEAVELLRLSLPLVRPFRSSAGTRTIRDVLVIRLRTAAGDGWAECVAEPEPTYLSEYTAGAAQVIEHHLAPRLLEGGALDVHDVGPRLAAVHGHRMAKAALEAAILDAQLRAEGISFGAWLDVQRSKVECGVALGQATSVDELVAAAEEAAGAGYVRIKLKIGPGWDIEPVTAVRGVIGREVLLQVDANGAYRAADLDHLAALDRLDLACIEQPLPADDLLGAARAAAVLDTPICLDESLTSLAAVDTAVALGACEVVCLKQGRVGGIIEALAIHDRCLGSGMPLWIGGMLETGIGRAVNAALAALPGATLPPDLGGSDRYWHDDITEPLVASGGRMKVPTGPGIGVDVRTEVLSEATTSSTTVRPT